MTSGFNINPDEVHKGADSLSSFTDEASGHLDRLSSTNDRVVSTSRGDRSGVGSAIVTGVTKASTAMADTGKQIIRVVDGASDRLHAGTDAHVENEHKQKSNLDGIHPEDKKITTKPESEGGSSSSSSSTTPSSMHEPPKPKGEPGADSTPPLLDKNKPPTATNDHSEQYKKQPDLPGSKPFDEPLPTSDKNSHGMPPDKGRGAKVEQIDESRVTRDPKTGLITEVDKTPVKDYIGNLSKQKAQDSSDPTKVFKDANPGLKKPPKNNPIPGKEKVCSAVAIDRQSGLVTHGVNGSSDDVIPHENLHPILQQNLQNLRGWQHEVQKPEGNSYLDGKAHESIPANHAEVKAVNELLWAKQAKLPPGQTLGPDAMKDISFDPRWTKNTGYGNLAGPAPACANCNTILKGAESYTGRYEYAPLDTRHAAEKIEKLPR